MNKLVFAVMAMLVAVNSHAATQQNYCGTDKIDLSDCKNIPGNRRDELGNKVKGGNPVAIAMSSGNLFAYYTISGGNLKKCQITSNVAQYKVGQNPKDVAAAYFVKNNELFDLRFSGEVSKDSCPKADTVNMNVDSNMGGQVLEFILVSDSNSAYVGVARLSTGVLGWSDKNYHLLSRETGYWGEIDYNNLKSQLQQ